MKKRTYTICTREADEGERLMKVLADHGIYNAVRKNAITFHEMIEFKCEKRVWKQIKSELNLTVRDVFAEFKG